MFGKKKETEDLSFDRYPYLLKLKPKERYEFHSDYFMIDNCFCTILDCWHAPGTNDQFPPFWGLNRIPVLSRWSKGVSVTCLEQVSRMSDDWIQSHREQSEGIAEMNANEQNRGGSNTTKGAARRKQEDMLTIAEELQDGASYLNVHYRLLIKAPSLKILDQTVSDIEEHYITTMARFEPHPRMGEQRRELAALLSHNENKPGDGYYYTSTEIAGSYNLVTHGLEDRCGEYVGRMAGDVNTAAVLFDVNRYDHHVVVASDQFDAKYGTRLRRSDMWGSKISQDCLLANGRVVHIILNNANLVQLGPVMKDITSYVNMTRGDINMFEMFGDVKDEISIFSTQIEKLRTMTEQLCSTNAHDRTIVQNSFSKLAVSFYENHRMWVENAASNRDKIRVVGLPHDEVPTLQDFVMDLRTQKKALMNTSKIDQESIHAINVIESTYSNLLQTNGDLFNIRTTDRIDNIDKNRRIIYDFSGLVARGKQLAMAQLVNVIGFAIAKLHEGDTVIIHGSEHIDVSIQEYMKAQFDRLYEKGGRVVFLYDSMEEMLANREFNMFDKANYLVMSNMTKDCMSEYQTTLGCRIPAPLTKLILKSAAPICYIRRGVANVVFELDLLLGLKSKGGR